MKRNLLIATASLVAIAALAQYIGSSKDKQQNEKVGKPILAVTKIKPLDEILIKDQKDQVSLKKIEGQWLITERENFPADPKKINQVFETLTTSKIDWLVTKDPDKLSRFNLLQFEENSGDVQATGTRILLRKKGRDYLNLVVGKQREPANENPAVRSLTAGTYIRIAPAPAVYLVKENLTFDSDPSTWIKTSLFFLRKDQIKSIRIAQADSQIEIIRETKDQELTAQSSPGSQPVSEAQINEFVKELGNFSIQALLPQKTPQTMQFQTKVVVELFDQTLYSFELDQTKLGEKSSYWVRFLIDPAETDSTGKTDFTKLVENRVFQIDEWHAKKWFLE